jgi:hypothetical protein
MSYETRKRSFLPGSRKIMANLDLLCLAQIQAFPVCNGMSHGLFPESSPIGTPPSACLRGDLDVTHLRPTARTSGRLHTCLARTWLW